MNIRPKPQREQWPVWAVNGVKKKEVKEKKENTKRLGMWSGLLDLKKERKKTERKERMDEKTLAGHAV